MFQDAKRRRDTALRDNKRRNESVRGELTWKDKKSGKKSGWLKGLVEKKNRELTREYDETVYNPRIKELIEEREKIGHIKGNFHDNGVGWTWWYCSTCGASFDKKYHGFNEDFNE